MSPPKPAIDSISLTQTLIRCKSITPEDAGALGVLEAALKPLGFDSHRLAFGDGVERVENLYARRGRAGPNFCFAGHTDVVPPGDLSAWSVDPFAGQIRDGVLIGRGAADMKGAIAAFVAAVASAGAGITGSVSLLITGDEEGIAKNGTRKVLDWLAAKGERIDHALVGEPTNPERLGEMIKIGRRGSLNAKLTVLGTQGHVAYPQQADNPIPRLLEMLRALRTEKLDEGTAHFQPSNLEITSIDVGNPTTNVIPARAEARFNIRFNDAHTGESLKALIEDRIAALGGPYQLAFDLSGEAFFTPPGPFTSLVAEAVREETGLRPALSTTGGTSDARFIKDHCPVIEFGLAGKTMHKIDEHVPVADIPALARIYARILTRYFA
jgi:succinyl-diaminopimelate desuccinylase